MGAAFVMLISSLAVSDSFAQTKTKSKQKTTGTEVPAADQKTTIIIDGDKITINGKPVTEYDGDRIVIGRRKESRAVEPYVYVTPRVHVAPRVAMPAMPPMPPAKWDYDYNYSWDNDVHVYGTGKSRGQLGVTTTEDAKGLKITKVLDESAASKSGLKDGDIITKVDGEKMDDAEDLYEKISEKKPGSEVEIEYLRDKKTMKQKVKLGETKVATTSRSSYFRTPQAFSYNGDVAIASPRRGESFRFYSGTPKLGIRIEDTEAGDGVRVLYVEEGSIAEKSGIKENDIITSIDSVDIKDTNRARNALMEAGEKKNFPMIVKRGGSPVTLDIKIPKTLQKTDL